MRRPRVVFGIYAVLLALYVAVIHPWLMTEADQRMALLGDKVAAGPETTYFTRAITINAPADQVWPRLVEILRSPIHGAKIYPR